MKIKEILEEKRKVARGTYSGVKPSQETKDKLADYMEENKIPNPVKPEKLHTTVLYSRKYLPNYKPAGKLAIPYKCKPVGFTVWKTNPEDPKEEKANCLIVKFKCPELIARHEELMKEHGATFDYDKYETHITLSYSIGDLNVDKLPKIDFDLEFDNEYAEELNLNWAKTKGTK
jgi:hypothetical protein